MQQPLLYLSLYFKQHSALYYELLDRVRTGGDCEAWVDFFLEGGEHTAQGAVQTAKRLIYLFPQDTLDVQGSPNLLSVLDALRRRPPAQPAPVGRGHQLSNSEQGHADAGLIWALRTNSPASVATACSYTTLI